MLEHSTTLATTVKIKPIGEDIYAVSHKLRLFGLPILTRMCLIKLRDGGLWVWSPTAINDQIKAEIDKLGPVRVGVSPNSFHHMYISQLKKHYPTAVCWAPQELQNRKKDFKFDGILGGDQTPSSAWPYWKDEIDYVIMRGSKIYSEALFLHKKSKTLIITDLLIQGNRTHWSVDWFWALYGVLHKPASSPFCKLLTRDRAAARVVMDQVAKWDFDRVVMAHGKVIDKDAKKTFLEAVSWIQ